MKCYNCETEITGVGHRVGGYYPVCEDCAVKAYLPPHERN